MSREDFILEVKSGEKSKSALCRAYGISRVTGDKWLERYENGEGLDDRSRAPFHVANKTPPAMERRILEVREQHPAWGPRKIRQFLINKGGLGLPSKSAIGNILKRSGCVSEAANQASTPYQRFQKDSCNEMWQTDFKGHFAMKDSKRCYPLTVLDDHSRYSLCVDAKDNERREGVEKSFLRLFGEYGLPDSLLCDNGNPWGASQSTGYTLFEIWLMDHGILPIHGRIRHPQTQGKEERFHRTLKAEVDLPGIANLRDAQLRFDAFRACYNNERPHEALHMGVPGDYYHPSERKKPERIREWAYPSGFVTRKIKEAGYVTYKTGYFLGEAFGGLTIGIRESALEGCINLYYRDFKIGRIDLRERAFVSKRLYRADPHDVGGEI
jgi:transposase InsO family protein